MATEKISTSIIADDAVSTDQIANNASISTSGNIATTGSGTLTVAGTSTLTGTLSVDTISEKTSANGVSVDGLKVKDYSLIYGSNTAITITSDGYVTKPNMPAFVADANNPPGAYTSTTGFFPADRTNHNQGNHYSTTTYKFTAPVDGVYLFTFASIHNNTSGTSRPMFYVNNVAEYNNIKHGVTNADSHGSGSNTTSSLIRLSANDYVTVKSQSGSLYFYDNQHSTFSGCLIG